MYLLDTNIVSELRKVRLGKADSGVAAWSEEVDAGDLYISAIALQELEIGVLRAEGLGVRAIAARLNRAPSTISRELRRNVLESDRGRYDPGLAHARAREQARRHRRPILALDPELRAVVQARLEEQWSPEQISAWLRQAHPDKPGWHLCHETIYQGLFFGGVDGLSRELTKNLRTGRSLRRRRRRREHGPRFKAPSKTIDLRRGRGTL